MSFKSTVVKHHLREFNFLKLFNELGWDKPGPPTAVGDKGRTYHFAPVAQKRGLQVFVHTTADGEEFPDYQTRLCLERQVLKSAQQHLLIFTDAARTRHVWQWVKREAGSAPRNRSESYYADQSGERLIQKLQHLHVGLDEEEDLTHADVVARRNRAFDVEKVTKKFYEQFREQHQAFLGFIDGLASETDRAWYASLMLNRLMFVYFIQRKRFLADDPDYLRNKLTEVKQKKGKNKFHTFYRLFLLRLFHEGLGQKAADRKQDLKELLDDVPYLNGGLFDVHELEADNPKIHIPDEAFERIFRFFDGWDWHLDDREIRNDREINPDVLGYIFEKYINQKQMGAYYTKEDITGYIARNTILPFVLNRAAEECIVAFRPDGAVWRLLRDDPDRYIFDAVRTGVDRPLPPDIEAGIADVAKRTNWNRPATADLALPTETWREHVARRQRCLEVREKLRDGKVTTVNDLVTLNLDIVRFTEARDHLFPRLGYVAHSASGLYPGLFAKVASRIHEQVLCKLAGTNRALSALVVGYKTKHFIFYQEATQYWVKATIGLPYYAKDGKVGAPAHGRQLFLETPLRASIACAIIHSSLFYLYFITYGDCFHLSDGLTTKFPIPKGIESDKVLAALCGKLMSDLKANAVKKSIQTKDGVKIRYDEYYASASKPIIDQIDAVLARHYGFTAEELDFIQNYDIKYRMGADDGAEDTAD